MPKRNIMQALNAVPQGGSPQHGFDLMNFEDFHSKGGQLTVVGVRDTVPNADYRVSVDAFTRTLPFNTANFSRIKENYYFVHVPLGLLCSNAYQMLVDRKQPYSALDQGIAQFPTFSLATVVARCIEIAHLDTTLSDYSKFRDVHGFNIGRTALKLLDLLGYGCFLDILEATFVDDSLTTDGATRLISYLLANKRPTANRLAAYQCIWYHFFRNPIYDVDVTARSFNFDDCVYKDSSSEPSYDILSVRTVDDFIIECCQLRYVGYKKDIFTGSMPGTQFGPVSSVNVNVTFSELTATFTGNSVTPTGTFTGSSSTPNIGVDKNGSKFTGNDAYDVDGVRTNLVSGSDNGRHVYIDDDGQPTTPYLNPNGYTVPLINGGIDASGHLGQPRVGSLMTDANDNFLGAGRDLSSNTKIYDTHNHTVPDHRHLLNVNPITPYGTITINPITPSGTVDLSGGGTSTSLFDVLQLVEAQAIQKWRQKSMLAGNKTVDQFRAHHGVVPRHLVDHIPDFIGSVDNEIHVTEITSQADTATDPDESNLGDIRGRGYGASDNRTFNFHCDDYGILFLLHAIVPENTYSSFGIDKGNTMISYTDFFQNEFQNIGLDVVPKYLIDPTPDAIPQGNPDQTGDGFNSQVGVVGYAPRYYHYKQYPSRVHGMFNPSRLTVGDLLPFQPGANKFGYSDFQSFVMPRFDMTGKVSCNTAGQLIVFRTFAMNLSKLYVNPSLFNSIFLENADSSELTDNFFSHVKFSCDASLPMTVLGLPQF